MDDDSSTVSELGLCPFILWVEEELLSDAPPYSSSSSIMPQSDYGEHNSLLSTLTAELQAPPKKRPARIELKAPSASTSSMPPPSPTGSIRQRPGYPHTVAQKHFPSMATPTTAYHVDGSPQLSMNDFVYTTSDQSPSTSTSALPTFGGQESLYGRTVKLTSRAQEMKEMLQDRRHRVGRSPLNSQPYRVATGPGPIRFNQSDDIYTDESGQVGMEEDVEEEEEDPTLYCTCRQKSHGDMVACDGKHCPYEWFHYTCVGISAPPKGKWLCSSCSASMRRSESVDSR